MTALVQRLGYVAMGVTDLNAAVEDAQNIAGARLVEKSADRALLSANSRHAELVLYRAHANELRCIGLQAVDDDAVDAVAERAQKAGLQILSRRPSLEVIRKAVTFATSEGHVIEVHTKMPESHARRHIGPGVHPQFLDHANLTSRDPEQLARELYDVLGMEVTERTTGYEIMWLRAGDNRHHTLAAVKADTGLHHFSWEFASFGDFKRIADTLDADDRLLVWGPGRHGAGDNLFTYYFDRSGFLVECIAEMEVIEEREIQARVSDPGENLSNIKVVNKWGNPPPIEWIQHHTPMAKPDWIVADATEAAE